MMYGFQYHNEQELPYKLYPRSHLFLDESGFRTSREFLMNQGPWMLLDFFGMPVTLNVFGQKKHRTQVGVFVSLCSMVFFVFAFQKKLTDYFGSTNVNVKHIILQEMAGSNLSIDSTKLMFALRLDIWQDNYLQNTSPSSASDPSNQRQPFQFRITSVASLRELTQNGVQKSTTEQTIPVEPCTENHFLGYLHSNQTQIQSYFNDVPISSFICPSLDSNYILSGNDNSPIYQYVKIEIVSCESSCWTQEEIDAYLAIHGFFEAQLVFNSYIPNYDDVVYLKSFIYDKKKYRIVPKKMKVFAELYFSPNEVYSDESQSWFGQYREETFVMHSEGEYRETIISTSSTDQTTFAQIALQRSSQEYQTTREYEKIDSILSYLGGFIQMVIVTAGLVMSIYNAQSLKLELANQLYSFENRDELSSEDKNYMKFKTREEFLRSIFHKLNHRVKNISLSASYLVYKLSFQHFFQTKRNILLDEVDKDLNIFEILERMHEVDKMKQVLFTEDQKKILEFSEKPQINIESIQKRRELQLINERQQELLDQQTKRKKSFRCSFKLGCTSKRHLLKLPTALSNQPPNINKRKKRQPTEIKINSGSDLETAITINWDRTRYISNMLIQSDQKAPRAERQTFQPFHQQRVSQLHNMSTYSQQFQQHQEHKREQSANGSHNEQMEWNDQKMLQNQSGVFNHNDQIQRRSQPSQNHPIKRVNMFKVLNKLRPLTFYSNRTDYSQFSAFYELYEACEDQDVYSMNPSDARISEKMKEFLRSDIKEVFKLAKKRPSRFELAREHKIKIFVNRFINNLQDRVAEMKLETTQKSNECRLDENKAKTDDVSNKYMFRVNSLVEVKKKSVQLDSNFTSQLLKMQTVNSNGSHNRIQSITSGSDSNRMLQKYKDSEQDDEFIMKTPIYSEYNSERQQQPQLIQSKSSNTYEMQSSPSPLITQQKQRDSLTSTHQKRSKFTLQRTEPDLREEQMLSLSEGQQRPTHQQSDSDVPLNFKGDLFEKQQVTENGIEKQSSSSVESKKKEIASLDQVELIIQ